MRVVWMWIAWSAVACGWADPVVSPPEGAAVDAPERGAKAGRRRQPRVEVTHGPEGKWFRAPAGQTLVPGTEADLIGQLEVLGYADGTQPAVAATGVTVHDAARTTPGWNLYSSGHAAEAYLTDLDGTVLHTWSGSFRDLFPDTPIQLGRYAKPWGLEAWRRVALLPGGDLVVVFAGFGIARIDRDSKRVWAVPVRAHHDVEVGPDGTVYTLGRKVSRKAAWDPSLPIVEDFFVEISPAGELKREISLVDAFLGTEFEPIARQTAMKNDIFHTNTLDLLDGTAVDAIPAFAAGNFLLSMRSMHALAVLDPDAGAITWAATGPWRAQHDAHVVGPARMLMFDNMGGQERRSRILELTLPSMAVSWRYVDKSDPGFHSDTMGTVVEQPGGNLLITSSEQGRALEITREGEIVWEFYNPHRAGDANELIAGVFEAIRVPAEADMGWLSP